MDFRETAWNHIAGEKKGEFYSAEQKYYNKILKLAEKYPDDVEIIAQNADGSMYFKLPVKWFKISPPKRVSEEQRQRMAERAKAMFGKRDTEEIDTEEDLDTEEETDGEE